MRFAKNSFLFTFTVALLAGLLVSNSKTAQSTVLSRMSPAFEGLVSGNFVTTGNTVLTCSTSSKKRNAASCTDARSRTGSLLDNDDFSMVHVKESFGSLSSTKYFNATSAELVIPATAVVKHATLFWSGSMRLDSGDTPANDSSKKDQVLLSVGNENCSLAGNPCLTTAIASDLYQVDQGTKLGPYRASADVTTKLSSQTLSWTVSGPDKSLQLSVANIQTTLGVNKSAGWSVMVVYETADESPHYIKILKGMAYESSLKDDEFRFEDFESAASGNVLSEVGLFVLEGDLGSNRDSVSISDAKGSASVSDLANPDNNIANSTISMNGEISSYLDGTGIGKHPNTFGIDADRISLVNAISKEVEYSDVIPSAYGDSYYIAGLAFAIEITSPDLVLTKTVDSITGADPVLTEAGDTIVYTIEIENVGQANATNVQVGDVLADDLDIVSTTGTDCPTIPSGELCKSLGTIRAGNSTSFQITAVLTGASLPSPGYFSNSVSAVFTGPLGSHSAVSEEVSVEYGALSTDLASSIAFGSHYIQAGQLVRFNATITNHGVADDSNPTVIFLARKGASLVIPNLPSGCTKSTTKTLVCRASAFGISAANPLAPGDSASVTFLVKPSSKLSTLLVWGTVTTGNAAGDPNLKNNTSADLLQINHSPKAKSASTKVSAGGEAKNVVLAGKISDPDGDALRVTLGKVSHGSAKVSGDIVTYTPPDSWTGTFRIRYTVKDGKGGVARSWIKVTVGNEQPPWGCLRFGC